MAYEFAKDINEFGMGNEVLINTGKPFEIENTKLANSLLKRGILKIAVGIGKEIAKSAAKKAIKKGVPTDIGKTIAGEIADNAIDQILDKVSN